VLLLALIPLLLDSAETGTVGDWDSEMKAGLNCLGGFFGFLGFLWVFYGFFKMGFFMGFSTF
jgi:hypothetical protein